MENFQLDVEGVITNISEIISGQNNKGAEWRKQSIVVESEGEYKKEIEVSFFNDLIQNFDAGQVIKLKCNVESRNHNGRYYTEIRAYKIL